MADTTQNAAAPVAESAPEAPSTEQSTENLEVSQEVSEETTEATPTEAATKEEAKIIKKLKQLKLKIDGKDYTEDLPFEIEEGSPQEEYLKKQLQLAKVAQKRMGETSEVKKKLEQVSDYLQKAKGNPAQVRQLMKELDIDEKALAAMIVEEEIERAKKSPEQLQREKLEQELQQLKEEREKEKKELESREYDRLVQQETSRYETMISDALKQSGLPESDFAKKRIAGYMQQALDKGLEVTAADVIPFVRSEMEEDIRKMFSSSPEEFIEQLLGKDNLKRLRKRNVEKLTQAPPVPLNKQIVEGGDKSAKSKAEPKISMKEFFKKL